MGRTSLVVIVTAVLVGGCGTPELAVKIPKSSIQSYLDGYFPLSADEYVDQELPVDVMIQSGEVILETGKDEIGIRLQIETTEKESAEAAPPFGLPGKPPVPSSAKPPTSGTVDFFCGIRYQADIGAFYLTDPRIDHVSLEVPEAVRKPVSVAVNKALAKYFDDNSVYQLSGEDKITAVAKMFLKDVQVSDGNVLLTLGP